MKTFISMLRGINVGGKKVIKMDALKIMFERLGFHSVRTYIQSGNVIFQYKETKTDRMAILISKEMLKCFGMNVAVIVKELSDLKSILGMNPFLKGQYEIDHLYITFLSKTPEKNLMKNIENVSFPPDQYCLKNKAVYLYLPNGAAKTKLSNTFFENKLEVSATSRNLRTLTEIIKISDNIFEKEG